MTRSRRLPLVLLVSTAACAASPPVPAPAPAALPASAAPCSAAPDASPVPTTDASAVMAAPSTSDAGLDATTPPATPPHETFTLVSKVLGETRRINLYVPKVPAASATHLPVLYLLDGGDDEDFPHPGVLHAVDLAIRTGEMRPTIVVGIENTERRRDMTGPTEVAKDRAIATHVSGSAPFRAFLRDELMPEINRRVGPTSHKAIAGESLAGLFVVETFFVETALFDEYIAISPSLWWNDNILSRGAASWLKSHPRVASRLYLAHASDDDRNDAIAGLAAALRTSAPRGLAWSFEPRSDLTHATIYESVAPSLVRRLWPPLPAR